NSFSNHGRYVSCVAHATNTLRQAGCLDKTAKTSIKKCAARSTCGKPGFVTCCTSVPGECNENVCSGTNPPVSCMTSDDCPPRSHCSIKQDAEACTAVAGTAGTSVSCCDACGG